MPEVPKLTSRHVSSVSKNQIVSDLPTTMAYDEITIHAQAKTDFWRQPPNIVVDNAPTRLISTPIDIHRFHSARVTVSANWNTLYDQGGLMLFIPEENIWLKTGIETYEEGPFVVSVVANRWSDCGIAPLGNEKGGKVTIQVERQVNAGEKMDTLIVSIVDEETGRKMQIRQITWWFTHDIQDQKISNETSDNRHLIIGVFAGRPTVPAGEGREHEELAVKLEGFEVKLFD